MLEYNQAVLIPGLQFTKRANANFSQDFKDHIWKVWQYFPELHTEVVYVGFIAVGGWARGCANSTEEPLKISLQADEKNFTIAHEFTHLLQGKRELGIPHSERACDIWALTRLPLELLDDYPSYVGSLYAKKQWDAIKAEVKALAFKAIEVRKTKRQYIVWFEDEMNKLVESEQSKEN